MTDWNAAFERVPAGNAVITVQPSPVPVKVIDDGKLDRGNIVEQLIAGAILLAVGITLGTLAKSKGIV